VFLANKLWMPFMVQKNKLAQEVENKIQNLKVQLLDSSDPKLIKQLRNRGLDLLNNFFVHIKDLPNEDKKDFGRFLNDLKNTWLETVQNKLRRVQEKEFEIQDKKLKIDVSEVDKTHGFNKNCTTSFGVSHPLMQEISYMNTIWQKLGFKVFEGRELDSDEYVFEKLNIPKGHPAREMWDTFYTQEGFVPTTQTSNMQIRMMRYFKKPPVRTAVYGKVFRNEELDAVHSHTFFQYEVVYVDKNVSLTNLIGILVEFLKQYYQNNDIEYRIMPAHFPFVEPGLEMHLKRGDSWLEILGAGMIHPNVLKAGGIDHKKYTGFAAGFGVDRMVMLKHGVKDLRDLYQGNITMYIK